MYNAMLYDFQPINLNVAKSYWIASKVVHTLLFKTYCNRIAWYCSTMRSGAGECTAFEIWDVVRNTLKPLANRTPSAFVCGVGNAMECKLPVPRSGLDNIL